VGSGRGYEETQVRFQISRVVNFWVGEGKRERREEWKGEGTRCRFDLMSVSSRHGWILPRVHLIIQIGFQDLQASVFVSLSHILIYLKVASEHRS
jgi:hypothetical protein